jgi:hypothetical protein
MFELMTALRQFLDERRDLALNELSILMTRHGATQEEMHREIEFYAAEWEEAAERQVVELAASLDRGGATLQ